MQLEISVCVRSSLWFVTLVVTERPQLILLKSSSVAFRQIFNMKGREKKSRTNVAKLLGFWLYQGFHLYFVASINPPQLLARDFLSLHTYGHAGKKLQCISRNRLQNEGKAPDKKQDSGGQATDGAAVRVVQGHRGHPPGAESGCSCIWGACGVSQGSD